MPRNVLALCALFTMCGCHGSHGSALPPGVSTDGDTPASPADGAADGSATSGPADAAASDAGPGTEAGAPAPDTAALTADTVWKVCGNLAADITALAQSPDGKWLAVGYADGRVTLVELAGMTVAGRLDTGARSSVTAMAFTADGGTLLTSAAGAVKLWSVPAAAFLRELGSTLGSVDLQVTGGPTPLVLVSARSVPSVTLWRLDGARLGMMGDGPFAAFTDGGSAVVVASEVGTVTTFGLDGKMLRRFGIPVHSPVLSPDGTLLATVFPGLPFERVELYSTVTGKRLWVSTDGVKVTRQLAFLDHPLRVVQLGDLGKPLVTDAATGKPLDGLPFEQAARIDPAADGSSLVAITRAGLLARVAVADGASRPGPASDFGLTQRILGLAVTRDGRCLAAAGASATWILDLRESSLVRALEIPGFKPDFSPDGTALAMGGLHRAIYKVADGHEITIDAGEAGPCLPSLVFSPDGKTLASGTCGRVELYRADGSRLGERPTAAVVAGVAWSPDGKLLGTTGPELWPIDGPAPLWPATVPPPPDNGEIKPSDNTVAFSPDGSFLLVSRSVGYFAFSDWMTTTDVVRATDGLVMKNLRGRLGRRPSFSPDGSWVVAGGYTFHPGSDMNRAITSDRASSIFLPDNRVVAFGTDRVLRLYCPTRP